MVSLGAVAPPMNMAHVGAWFSSRVAVRSGRIGKGCPFFFRHEERRATPDSDDKRCPQMAHFLASDQASFINFAEDPQGRGGVSSRTGSYLRMSPNKSGAQQQTQKEIFHCT